MNALEKYAQGISILDNWFKSDGEIVSPELAQSRANICAQCPHNKSGLLLVEMIAAKLKPKMEEKVGRPMNVNNASLLKTCKICNCYLPVKIFFTLQSVMPVEEEKVLFWEKCWIRNE